MSIRILTCGGTIDKIYFDAKSEFQVGDPQIATVLDESNVTVGYTIQPLFQKDSLEMTDDDRAVVRCAVRDAPEARIVVTHGTDTMAATARALGESEGKTVVFTGSMAPARFRESDAIFNIGCAFAAVQLLPEGVYLAMNGRVFDAHHVRKNVAANRFEIE